MQANNFDVHRQRGNIVHIGPLEESKTKKKLYFRKFVLSFNDYKGQIQSAEFICYGNMAFSVENIGIGIPVLVYFNLSGYQQYSSTKSPHHVTRLICSNIEIMPRTDIGFTKIQATIAKNYENFNVLNEEENNADK